MTVPSSLRLLALLIACCSLQGCLGGRPLHEIDYQRYWCEKNHGELEHRLGDGARVDCLTGEYAVEVEYAHKWAEAIGQSLYYARMTGKKPGVVLIIRENGDQRFARRLRAVAQQQGIRVWTVRPRELE